MKWIQCCCAGFIALLAVSSAGAQGTYSRPTTSSYSPPPVSPYLNMVRGGNPAVNYYGLVRPQMDSQRAIQQLQQNTGVPQSTTGLTMDGLPNSAHPVQFMNFSHYFNGNPGTSAVGHLPAGQATGVGGGRR